jgi:hypothetical protein
MTSSDEKIDKLLVDTNLIKEAFSYNTSTRKPGRPTKSKSSSNKTTNIEKFQKDSTVLFMFSTIVLVPIKRIFSSIKHIDPKFINFTTTQHGFMFEYYNEGGVHLCKDVYENKNSKCEFICKQPITVGLEKDLLIKITQNIGEKCNRIIFQLKKGIDTSAFYITYINDVGVEDDHRIDIIDPSIIEIPDYEKKFDMKLYPIKIVIDAKLFKQYFIDKVQISPDLIISIQGSGPLNLTIRSQDSRIVNICTFGQDSKIVESTLNEGELIVSSFSSEDIKILSSVLIKCFIHVYINKHNMMCQIKSDESQDITQTIIIESSAPKKSIT